MHHHAGDERPHRDARDPPPARALPVADHHNSSKAVTDDQENCSQAETRTESRIAARGVAAIAIARVDAATETGDRRRLPIPDVALQHRG